MGFVMLVKQNGNNQANNYVLDTDNNQININIGSFSAGLYTIALVVDGQIVDSKTLIKQ